MKEAYKLWHSFLPHLPRLSRYTIGGKIDALFTDVIELTLTAAYASREHKLGVLQRANVKFDALKFFLQLSWDAKLIDSGKFAALSAPLTEIGKSLGGWISDIRKKTPAQQAGE